MRVPIGERTGNALYRFLRGVAFGGIGASVGAFGAWLVGAERDTIIYVALFTTLLIGGWLNRVLGGGGGPQR
jgi:hypothetical protein